VPLVRTRELYVVPVVSANGRHLAWVTSRTIERYDEYASERVFTIHAYAARHGREMGTTSLESRATCCDQSGVIHVVGVDNDGAVLLERQYDRVWSWRPGGVLVSVRGLRVLSLETIDIWPGGASWQTTGHGFGPMRFGRIERDGSVTSVGRILGGGDGRWAPDGASYVYEPFDKAAASVPGAEAPVVWAAGRRVRLNVTHPGPIVGWEDRHSVIVLSRPQGPRLVRRSATLVR
jgi:hypothetical protein